MKNKRIIIYLGHPAQFYFFKYIIKELRKDGNQVKILLKTKDILEQIVKEAGFEYENIQQNVRKNTLFSIAKASFMRTFKMYKIARKYKADIIIGSDASVSQTAKLLKIYGVTVLEDDIDVIAKMANISYPFTDSIVVPSVCRVGKWESKKVPYNGYMKLAYLHPNRFTPDISLVRKYIYDDKYCLVRLAQLTAFHDVGISGLNVELVLKVITIAQKYGYKIFISSESELDKRLSKYQLNLKYSDIHHVMNYASMLISDSQSMSVESAMLGVPSLRFSDFAGRISVLEELEKKYGLTYGIKTDKQQELLNKMEELLNMTNLREEFQNRRRKMLNDKIDVSAFFVWFIENYPISKKIIMDNPKYQNQFK